MLRRCVDTDPEARKIGVAESRRRTLDDADDRPLIIDQPEENLDPKSVFDELVSLFIIAKAKRQVIMVTHNANLVINTDADQVIVADAEPHADGGLPRIAYQAGGLEDAEMRKAVCDILEGRRTRIPGTCLASPCETRTLEVVEAILAQLCPHPPSRHQPIAPPPLHCC